MYALIDNLHDGFQSFTVHHGLQDTDVLAAMPHFVVAILWIGEISAIYPHHLIHVEGWKGEERVRGWEGSEGGGEAKYTKPRYTIQSPNR